MKTLSYICAPLTPTGAGGLCEIIEAYAESGMSISAHSAQLAWEAHSAEIEEEWADLFNISAEDLLAALEDLVRVDRHGRVIHCLAWPREARGEALVRGFERLGYTITIEDAFAALRCHRSVTGLSWADQGAMAVEDILAAIKTYCAVSEALPEIVAD